MDSNRSRTGQRKRPLVVTLLGDYNFKKAELESCERRHIESNHPDQANDAPVFKKDFEILPAEVCAKIFMHLDFGDRIRSERVCRRWKTLLETHVWSKVQSLSYWTLRNHPRRALVGKDKKITQLEILSVARRCRKYLRNVNLECLCITDTTPYLTINIVNGCNRLSSLHIGLRSLTPHALKEIGACCPLLEHFTSTGPFTKVPFHAISDFLRCCQRLQEIVLNVGYYTPSGTISRDNDGLPWIAALARTVSSLHFICCHFSENALAILSELCPNLGIIRLDSFAISASGEALASFQELTTLCLYFCTYNSSRIGERIGSLRNLRELALKFAKFSPHGMNAIVKGCSSLKCVSLKFVVCEATDFGSLALLKHLTCLELMHSSYYHELPNPEEGGEPDQFNLDDELLNRITGMRQLRFLSLQMFSNLTRIGVVHALDNNKKLICLAIKDCPGIEQEALRDDLVSFARDRQGNMSDDFSWSSIERDIGGYIAIDDYNYTPYNGAGSFPYNDFRSFLQSHKLIETRHSYSRFDQLHLWSQRLLIPWTSHQLLRCHYCSEIPYILHAGYQNCYKQFSLHN